MDIKQAALFVGHRFLMTLFLLIVIPTVVFAMQEAVPGDLAVAALGPQASPESIEAARAQMGLDDSLTTRYFNWLGDSLITRDFGDSLRTRQPAYDVFTERLSASLEILIPALMLSIALGLPFGMLAGGFAKQIPDVFVRYTNLLMTSPAIFWVALVLILYLGIERRALPVTGRCSFDDCSLSDRVDHLTMPVASLVLFWSGAFAYMTRNFIVDFAAKNDDRSTSSSVIVGAMLALPVVFPAMLAAMLGGLVLIETVFAYPGIGRLAFDAAISRDYPMISTVVTMTSLAVAGIYFLSMLAYALFSLIFSSKPDGFVVTPQHPVMTVAEQQRFDASYGAPKWGGGIQQILGLCIMGLALVMLLGIVGVALFAGPINDEILGFDHNQQSLQDRFLPLGADDHPLGTDSLGRDALARLLVGGRASLQISFVAAIISVVIGVAVGVVGGVLDDLPGSIINVPLNWLMLPFSIMPMLLLLLLVIMIDGPSKSALILGLGLLGWTNIPPIVRARVRSIRRGKLYQANNDAPTLSEASEADESDDVAADESPETDEDSDEVQTTPASTNNVLWHVAISPLLMIVYFLAVNTATFLLLEAALSFLGMGVQPPEPSLGLMLADSQRYMQQASHLIFAPGLAIALIVACLMFVAEGIRSTFDFTA